ncbi:MAG: DUF6519 domain-containing protein [Bacteroidota bacterium]
MESYDISRVSFDPKKRYVGVRRQQGRVQTDFDHNEDERLKNEERRKSRRHIIGPYGSPDHGFRCENLRLAADGRFDFDIQAGHLYLGGLALRMDPLAQGPPLQLESYRRQRDWLQQTAAQSRVPLLPAGGERYDLVYLEAWQQSVSAVEDNELLEPALGGPDTTTRIRNMRRVQVQEDVGTADCLEAWEAFRQSWQARQLGVIDDEFLAATDATLTVSYSNAGLPRDLCSPSVLGGYLGAENQAIRVQLVDDNHLTWGYDNASALYRVRLGADRKSLTFLNEPRDQFQWPLSGQVVELLSWSAVLSNGEKTATQQGLLNRVESSYQPNTQQLTLLNAVPPSFGVDWQSREAGTTPDYFYLRVWDRGEDVASPMSIPFVPGTALDLGNSGLRIEINGSHRVGGDHWVIAARPRTPRKVLPWILEQGKSPDGVDHYYAPLAIIHWVANAAGEVSGSIIRDCRKTFRPLTDLEGCCSYHVGDGVRSFGDFNSIEEAVRHLPAAGGHICVLPGRHEVNLELRELDNISITGCGERSILVPGPQRQDLPLIRMANVQNIEISKLKFIQPLSTAIQLIDLEKGLDPSAHIRIQHNQILAGEYGIYIEVDDEEAGDNQIYIGHNLISLEDREEGKNGIFCLADEVRIERNKLIVIPAQGEEGGEEVPPRRRPPEGFFDPCQPPGKILARGFGLESFVKEFFAYLGRLQSVDNVVPFQSWGGIRIGSGSESVLIDDNVIIGGASNGITFGDLPNVERLSDAEIEALGKEYELAKKEASVSGLYQSREYTGGMNASLTTNFRGYLYDIRIEQNLIRNMGLSGIGSLAFFDLDSRRDGMGIHIQNLSIYRNTIRFCARQIPEEIADELEEIVGYGGIALSSCENARMEENLIEDNGLSFVDPICGIYVRNGEDIEISRNRILNNGPRLALGDDSFGLSARARRGQRGGIYIGLSFKRQFVEAIRDELLSDGVPAAKIHGNIVVQPLGQALLIVAWGPVSVVGNQLTSHELDFGNPLSTLAGTVLILNLGVSKDLFRMPIDPSFLELANLLLTGKEFSSRQSSTKNRRELLLLAQYLPSGSVLFANNQVVLDVRNLEIDLALSAQVIATLDDVGYHSNQSECKGLAIPFERDGEEELFPLDYILFNTVLAGISIRTTDNRFQEGFTGIFYSLLSLGLLNTTLGNQSSNCLLTYGTEEARANNLEQILSLRDCDNGKKLFGELSGLQTQSSGTETSYLIQGSGNLTFDGF